MIVVSNSVSFFFYLTQEYGVYFHMWARLISNYMQMPGNQASPDRDDVELKVSYMVKRSQGKSTLGAVNFKKRVFVLSPTRLTYYDGTIEVGRKLHC